MWLLDLTIMVCSGRRRFASRRNLRLLVVYLIMVVTSAKGLVMTAEGRNGIASTSG
jgi:hypothetical protein